MTPKAKPFSTFDMMALIALVATVCSVSGAILAETFRQDPRQSGVETSALTARQISVPADHSSNDSQDRGPASVGTSPSVGAHGLDRRVNGYHFSAGKLLSTEESGADEAALVSSPDFSTEP